MVPLFLSKLGQDSSSSCEVVLLVVIFPHQVQHCQVVRLTDYILLQVRLQIHRLHLLTSTAYSSSKQTDT